jgi:hypothetical protein
MFLLDWSLVILVFFGFPLQAGWFGRQPAFILIMRLSLVGPVVADILSRHST